MSVIEALDIIHDNKDEIITTNQKLRFQKV